MTIKALVVTGFGINADEELSHAFNVAGAEATRVHVTDIVENPSIIENYHILGFPGGFAFGDHLGSGRVLSNLIKNSLKEKLSQFIDQGKLIIGICNGFQAITKLGIVPNQNGTFEPETSLVHNAQGTFLDTWVKVSFEEKSPCIWTKGLEARDFPIRHGEGNLVASEATIKRLEENNLVALRYVGENPNGTTNMIAGITDPTGRVLGLMPHPEQFIIPEMHPLWYRQGASKTGLDLFINAFDYCKKNL